MAKETIAEEELDRLFQGSDLVFAVEMLDAYRRENMWRLIYSKYRSFNDEDIHEVYVRALEEFIECVKNPDFDRKAPLKLFQHIVKKRAIDRARKKYGARIKAAGDLIEPLAVDLKDTKAGLEWRLMFKEEGPAFQKALDKAVSELAPKQQVAAQAMLEVYAQIREDDSPKALAARIREMTGEDCTAAKAADRWEAARENLKEKMTEAGFKHLFEDLQ
jgi:hypothetical protein